MAADEELMGNWIFVCVLNCRTVCAVCLNPGVVVFQCRTLTATSLVPVAYG